MVCHLSMLLSSLRRQLMPTRVRHGRAAAAAVVAQVAAAEEHQGLSLV
jgi:hypothetical protein